MGHAINRPVRRLDVVEKVTGQAMYGADLKFERMLYGKGLYAEHPHARIVSIDASEAEAEPTAEQLAEMEAADAAAATETPEADPEEKE